MAETLDYRSSRPAVKASSRGTLARAAMLTAVGTCAVESLAIGAIAVFGRPAWLVLGCAILLFAAWFVTVVFGIVALIDRDGPRSLAAAALATAGVGACLPLVIPLMR